MLLGKRPTGKPLICHWIAPPDHQIVPPDTVTTGGSLNDYWWPADGLLVATTRRPFALPTAARQRDVRGFRVGMS